MSIRPAFLFLVVSLVSCGQIDQQASVPAIVGGKAARAGDPVAKTTVSLIQGRHSFCTGVVVAPRFVLTAAHCLEHTPTGNFHVYFGLVATPEAIDDALLLDVEEIRGHEGYRLGQANVDPETGLATEPVNDIALVELTEDALAAPATIVSARDSVSVGEPIVLAGFGKTAAANGASGELRRVETALGAELPVSKEIEIQRGPLNSCDGDSGGPLYLKREHGLALLGILSRGDEECRSIAVYTDVRAFRDWLTTTMDAMVKNKVIVPPPPAPAVPRNDGPSVPPLL